MKKYLFVIYAVVVCFSEAKAQDFHFSQFYASPLSLNPAMTGLTYGKMRLMGNYRNQWATISPFTTFSVGADMAIGNKKDGKDYGGIGAFFLQDGVENGFSLTHVRGSFAYHKSLNNGNSYLALGVQGGIEQVDLSVTQNTDGLFPSVVDESISGSSSFTDFQAGLFWYSYLGAVSSYYIGFSAFHLAEPSYSIVSTSNKLYRKYVAHLGGRFQLANKVNLTPSLVYMSQGNATEINIGTALEFDFSKENSFTAISIGGWYRVQDAFITVISAEFTNMKIGFSYDSNLSDLKITDTNPGGIELSLIYTITGGGGKKETVKVSANPYPSL